MNNNLYIPGKSEEETDDLFYAFKALEEMGKFFHIGQSYEKKPAEKQRCATCKTDKFEIAIGSYYTAIRCPNCRWEKCIHEG